MNDPAAVAQAVAAPAIAQALVKAASELQDWCIDYAPGPDEMNGAARVIAAFLRALPEDTAYTMVPLPLELAAAVEAAAGEQG